MAQAGQNQNISEQQLAQQQPLSLLSQLFGATPSTPTQPLSSASQTSVAPTDVTGATASANNAAMSAYQAQLASNNATTGAGAGMLGSAAIAAATMF
jgi:prophage DNA circulation protein